MVVEPCCFLVSHLNARVAYVRQVPLCVILEIVGHGDPEGSLPTLQVVLVDDTYSTHTTLAIFILQCFGSGSALRKTARIHGKMRIRTVPEG